LEKTPLGMFIKKTNSRVLSHQKWRKLVGNSILSTN